MKLSSRIILLTAEGFGLGRINPAPGTWGSLWGIPIGWTLGYFDTTWWMRLLVGLIMFIIGVPICGRGATLRGIRTRGQVSKDPGSVVWDEMSAFPLVFAFAPLTGKYMWLVLVLGFAVFRFFDIWKPPPVSHFDQLSGGFAIMADDTMAAMYASVTLFLITRFI